MPDPAWIHSANLGLRAGLVALLLLLAAVLLRDHGRSVAARLGALCAAGAAVYAICLPPDSGAAASWWQWPLAALTTGNAMVFWLLSRTLFDDGFVPRPRHGLAWAALAGAGVLHCAWLRPGQPGGDALGVLILLATLACSVLAVGQSLATWQADLIEGRRRLRIFIVAGGAAYTLLNTGSRLVLQPSVATGVAELAVLIDAIGLALVVVPIVWQLVGGSHGELFPVPTETGAAAAEPLFLRELSPNAQAAATPSTVDAEAREPANQLAALVSAEHEPLGSGIASEPAAVPATPVSSAHALPAAADTPDPADSGLIEALVHSMESERLYREEGLTIGALAQRLGVPEHRLRRLINQRLGHRNFNQYLNGYRLAEAKAALADPDQAELPVLTIAMDAGFQSLGPFNRAFKADTGITPSEYRRLHGQAAKPGGDGREAADALGRPLRPHPLESHPGAESMARQ